MARPTGFLEYRRIDNLQKPVEMRVLDFDEFTIDIEEEERRLQGARCMDCGVPFCQSGSGCPICNVIPEWNDLIYQRRYREALESLLRTNNFPEFTGLVCPAPCEAACVLSLTAPAVAIKENERFLSEIGFENGWISTNPPQIRTGRRVAVVGSGPAGLAAADQLNRAGHAVTVFEKDDRPGGLLMYGIPNMKLGKSKVLRRVRLMEEEGVRFRLSTDVGGDIAVQELAGRYDAVLLACGAGRARDLPVEGRSLPGISFAVDYLKGSTKRLLDGRSSGTVDISALGKDVIVIGGGDTGNDCIATAIRQGCRSVKNLEILPEPPKARQSDNPWPEWPRVMRTGYGYVESMRLYSADPREYSIMVKKFAGEGRIESVQTVRVERRKTEDGRWVMDELPGTRETIPADLVVLAMGFTGPQRTLIDALALETDSRSNVSTKENCFETSRPGIFAAGDMRRGQSLVVWAINEGRGAAREIDRFLMGSTQLP